MRVRSGSTVSSSGRALPAGPVDIGVALVLLSMLTACTQDRRVSLAEVTAYEPQTAAASQPVVVEPSDLTLAENRPYVVQTGDTLTIRMVGTQEDRFAPTTIDARVLDDGRVLLPLVGSVEVAGKTLAGAETAVHEAYVDEFFRDLAVHIQVAASRTTTVFVLGAVAHPGLVALKQNERNVLYALLQAGLDAGTGAPLGRVHVRSVRRDRPEAVYNFHDVEDLRRALIAPPLESGDQVRVEAGETSAVYLSGLVARPGPILLPPNSTLSLVRAVAAAGGTRDYITVKDATLVRSLPDGRQLFAKVELDKIMSGEAPDVALHAGDVLHVTQNADTFVQEWFLKNVLLGPFSLGVQYDPLAQYNANRAIDASDDDSLQQGLLQSIGSGIPGIFVPPAPVVTQP